MSFKLSDSPQGKAFIVRSLSGDAEMNRRLREMGFFEGAHVVVRSRLPFGGPLVVQVDEFSLALRKSEAELIVIEEC